MKFEFWLIDESESVKLLLPVTPGAYEVDYGNDIQIVNATAKGDIPITGYRRLMSIQLEGFFTTQEYPFVNQATYPVTHAMDYVQLIKSWVDKKKIIRRDVS